MWHMAKYLQGKVHRVHITTKGIYFTIETHPPKKQFFFRSKETILKVPSYSGFKPLLHNNLEGQVLRMVDLISRFARQLKCYILRKIISCKIFVLDY